MHGLKIILLSSAFNALTQRAYLELQAKGHSPSVVLFTQPDEVCERITRSNADIVICPFLKHRVPETLWRHPTRPVIILHPGIQGDRGCSSLDWAISKNLSRWGVTALQAKEEMDAGPVWSTCEFDMPANTRKSELYNGAVSDAALCCIYDVIDKFSSGYQPIDIDYQDPRIQGRLQPVMTQRDRAFNWSDAAEHIKRCVDAADGQPGVLAEIAGAEYYLYDAHLCPHDGAAGEILAVKGSAVLIGTGRQSLWIGALRKKSPSGAMRFKLPASQVLKQHVAHVKHIETVLDDDDFGGYHPVRYREYDRVGELTMEFYNGALSCEQCQLLKEAICWAKEQDTDVLVLRGGRGSFCNGIHLNVICAASSPEQEAWQNIQAIDDVCFELLSARQRVVSAITGNAGAGGVMLALTADVVFAREGVVLNPHYQTMGLFGSEYWTYTLPHKVGTARAAQLTQACLPVSCRQALAYGLVDAIGPADHPAFLRWLRHHARNMVMGEQYLWGRVKARDPEKSRHCRESELVQMHADMIHNRSGFHEKCQRFVLKCPPCSTPQRLIADWAEPKNLADSNESVTKEKLFPARPRFPLSLQ